MPRVAVVTGSNRGIGEAVVRRLRKEGCRVVSNGRSARKGPGDLHVRADAATAAGAKALVAAARKLGGLDLLVCAAGDFEYTPVSELDLGAWDALFESNLKSVWHPVRAALPLLRRSRGSIVTFGGPAIQTARGNPRAVAYQMAKTALAIFTKSLAQAEAARGVRVNMVSPGFIRTWAYTKKEVARCEALVPARRMGRPDEIAEAVAWLASDAASYVTGAVLDVGGGLRV